MENIFNIKDKFVFIHDSVLELIINIFIMFITFLNLFKIVFVGNFLIEQNDEELLDISKQNKTKLLEIREKYNITILNVTMNDKTYFFSKDDILKYTENLSFGLFVLSFLLIILFVFYSIPSIKSLLVKEKMYFPKFLFKQSSFKLKDMVIDFLWKPFWENLFIQNEILNMKLDFENNLINKNFYYSKIGHLEKDFLIKKGDYNASKRLEAVKKKMGNDDKDASGNPKQKNEMFQSNIILFT